jgi:hypothetical protein
MGCEAANVYLSGYVAPQTNRWTPGGSVFLNLIRPAMPDWNSRRRIDSDIMLLLILPAETSNAMKPRNLFYGAPDELMDLERKLYDVTQIAQYVGRG